MSESRFGADLKKKLEEAQSIIELSNLNNVEKNKFNTEHRTLELKLLTLNSINFLETQEKVQKFLDNVKFVVKWKKVLEDANVIIESSKLTDAEKDKLRTEHSKIEKELLNYHKIDYVKTLQSIQDFIGKVKFVDKWEKVLDDAEVNLQQAQYKDKQKIELKNMILKLKQSLLNYDKSRHFEISYNIQEFHNQVYQNCKSTIFACSDKHEPRKDSFDLKRAANAFSK